MLVQVLKNHTKYKTFSKEFLRSSLENLKITFKNIYIYIFEKYLRPCFYLHPLRKFCLKEHAFQNLDFQMNSKIT